MRLHKLKLVKMRKIDKNSICEKLIGLCKQQLRLLSKSQGESWLDMLFYAKMV